MLTPFKTKDLHNLLPIVWRLYFNKLTQLNIQFLIKSWNYLIINEFSFVDEGEYRNLILWLEDQKIRHYKIEDRAGLRNMKGSDWMKAFNNVIIIIGISFLILSFPWNSKLFPSLKISKEKSDYLLLHLEMVTVPHKEIGSRVILCMLLLQFFIVFSRYLGCG